MTTPLVRKLFARAGLTIRSGIDIYVPSTTYTYDPARQRVLIDISESPEIQIHELGHCIVARPKDRLLPNWGLGESLEEYESLGWFLCNGRDPKREYPLTTKFELNHAEARASVMHVLLAKQFFGAEAKQVVLDYLNVTDSVLNQHVPTLQRWKVIDEKKHWTGRIRC